MQGSDDWGGWFSGLGKSVITTAIDYKIADLARDNNMQVPDSNPFRAYPETVKQPITNNNTPSGSPLRFFVKKDGAPNPLGIGIAVLAVALVLR